MENLKELTEKELIEERNRLNQTLNDFVLGTNQKSLYLQIEAIDFELIMRKDKSC